MKYLFRLYQICIGVPLTVVLTIITSLTTTIGCALGKGDFWGYHPARLWAAAILKIFFIRVTVVGRENVGKDESCVFVSNHQGAFDIFLIYGHLGHNFKWMMKAALKKMPFVGFACDAAHHIFVDRSTPASIEATIDKAHKTLRGGMSLVVFPEGTRSRTGRMGNFKRGAFLLADELQLPVVPMTINGSFDILPISTIWFWVRPVPITLTIH